MQLIGMLDSPFVRRVAISLQLLGLPFEHRPISIFRSVAEFQKINPLVKAPTLVCDDGTVLMDSTLILQYAEALVRPRTLMPAELPELQRAQRIIGLALVACEKGAQIIYERDLRPPEKIHAPWIERVTSQLIAAFSALGKEIPGRPHPLKSSNITQPYLTTAVAWYFIQRMLPGIVDPGRFPALVELSEEAEALAQFRAAPYGDSTYRQGG